MLTETEALAELRDLVAADSEPKMSDDQLKRCLRATARAKVWEAGTVYTTGDRVVTGNGRVYICTSSGTSGQTFAPFASVIAGYQHVDGTAIWRDNGPAHAEIFDVRGAAHEAWKRKAGKVAEQVSFSSDGKRFELDQLFQHCNKMANRYLPVVVA